MSAGSSVGSVVTPGGDSNATKRKTAAHEPFWGSAGARLIQPVGNSAAVAPCNAEPLTPPPRAGHFLGGGGEGPGPRLCLPRCLSSHRADLRVMSSHRNSGPPNGCVIAEARRPLGGHHDETNRSTLWVLWSLLSRIWPEWRQGGSSEMRLCSISMLDIVSSLIKSALAT